MSQSVQSLVRNSSLSMRIHVLEWRDGSEKDSMELLRNKLQSLYSSMEVQILPMLTKMPLNDSHFVILSMLDLLENSSSLESVLLSYLNRLNPIILVSLKINLRKRLIYLKGDDFITPTTQMEQTHSGLHLALAITGLVRIYRIKTPE